MGAGVGEEGKGEGEGADLQGSRGYTFSRAERNTKYMCVPHYHCMQSKPPCPSLVTETQRDS